MMSAMEKVRQTGTPIRATAREFGLPEASLRHKLSVVGFIQKPSIQVHHQSFPWKRSVTWLSTSSLCPSVAMDIAGQKW